MADKVDKLLEENSIMTYFKFTVFPKYKVKIKEVMQKHNKEIGWKFTERNTRDENGDRMHTLELHSVSENLTDLGDKVAFFVGLIEDIYNSVGAMMDEETVVDYNTRFIGVALGNELNNLENTDLTFDKEKTYYYTERFGRRLHIFVDINRIIEIEKKYPLVIQKIYGETVQEWYEGNVEVLKKMFVKKSELESAQAIVELLEKHTKIEKIPYKLKRFRFATE